MRPRARSRSRTRNGYEIDAYSAADFFPALEAAEAARKAWDWLVGAFLDEAGYLFEPKLRPLVPEGRRTPLMCFGAFDAPREAAYLEAPAQTTVPIFDARPAAGFADYDKRFQRLHQHLRQGDCYQGNLTFPIDACWSGDALAAFDALTVRQPVKYGALVRLGEPVILSCSPENFQASRLN